MDQPIISESSLGESVIARLQALQEHAARYAAAAAKSTTLWGGATIYAVEVPHKHPWWRFWARPVRTFMTEGSRLGSSMYLITQVGIYCSIDYDAGHGTFYYAVPVKNLPVPTLEWIEKQPLPQ